MDERTDTERGFNGVVLCWLRADGETDATEVVAVRAYGTDWAGDTEGGFYHDADVTIQFRSGDGPVKSLEVTGEAMGSLWQHVMRSWPTEPASR